MASQEPKDTLVVSKRDKINQNSDKKPTNTKTNKSGVKSGKKDQDGVVEDIDASNGDQTPLSNDLNLLPYHSNANNIESSEQENQGGTTESENFSQLIQIGQAQEDILDFENFIQAAHSKKKQNLGNLMHINENGTV